MTTTAELDTTTIPGFPPVVYVPTSDATDPALREVLLHEMIDGRTALFAYSAIDRLFSFYQADSAWLLCDVAGLQVIYDQTPYELLYLDRSPDSADRQDPQL